MRSGTLKRHGHCGTGQGMRNCAEGNGGKKVARLRVLRDRLKAQLEAKLDEVFINGSMEHRLPNNLNMSFAYVEANRC